MFVTISYREEKPCSVWTASQAKESEACNVPEMGGAIRSWVPDGNMAWLRDGNQRNCDGRSKVENGRTHFLYLISSTVAQIWAPHCFLLIITIIGHARILFMCLYNLWFSTSCQCVQLKWSFIERSVQQHCGVKGDGATIRGSKMRCWVLQTKVGSDWWCTRGLRTAIEQIVLGTILHVSRHWGLGFSKAARQNPEQKAWVWG